MPKEKKNPIIAGKLNMFLPRAGCLYVNNDRNRFLRIFIGGILLIVVMVVPGNAIQKMRDDGLISEQEYQKRKNDLSVKKLSNYQI